VAETLATLTAQLHAELTDNARLRARLRAILDCTDHRCHLCAGCLDAATAGRRWLCDSDGWKRQVSTSLIPKSDSKEKGQNP